MVINAIIIPSAQYSGLCINVVYIDKSSVTKQTTIAMQENPNAPTNKIVQN
jgi:hypothetical protein